MELLPVTLSAALLLLVGPFCGECCGMASSSPRKADFYVSAGGSDDWSGSLPVPNARGADGTPRSIASLQSCRQSPYGFVVFDLLRTANGRT